MSEQAAVEAVKPQREFILGTGRRKTAVARVRLTRGSGKITVNGKDMPVFFNEETDRARVLAPFAATKMQGLYDCLATVEGGGFAAQAGAVSLGVARALAKIDENFTPSLREQGLLTRDSRMKERKKYGLHGARRGTQFSKR